MTLLHTFLAWKHVAQVMFLLPILLGDISVIYVSGDVSVWWADALAANILKVL